MATIKGQNLRLFLDDKAIAAATTCTVHVAMTFSDKSTKDSTDKWANNQPTGMNWDCSASALVTLDDGSSTMPSGVTADELTDMIGTEVDVLFTEAVGPGNRISGTKLYKGTAVISDVQVNAPKKEDSTITIQLTGTGMLKTYATVTTTATFPSAVNELAGETFTFSKRLGANELAGRLSFTTPQQVFGVVYPVASDDDTLFFSDLFMTLVRNESDGTIWEVTQAASGAPITSYSFT